MYQIYGHTARTLPAHSFNQLAIALINIVTVYLLYLIFKNRGFKDAKGKVFVLMAIFMLLWVDFAYLARLFGNHNELSTLLLKIAWVSTPALFYSVYLISTLFTDNFKKLKWLNVTFLGLVFLFGIITGGTDLVIKGVKTTGMYLDIIYGYAFFPFLGFIFILILATVLPNIRSFTKKRDIKFFLIGILIFYVLNLIFNIALPVFFGVTHLYFFGDYSTIILLSFTLYSIARYQFFEIRAIATEIITVILWVVLLSKLFTARDAADFLTDGLLFLLSVVFGILLVRSIYTEVRQKQQLQELNKKLKELDKQKDEFVSMAAHELRSPLTAIKGYVSMIIEGDTGDIPEKARQYLADSMAVTDRLVRLVNNMLNVSRIEEGRIVYQMEDTPLIRAVQEVFYSYRIEAERKGLDFTLDVPNGLDDLVYVDPDRVREVIGNLVSNAVKFTEKGGIKIRMSNPKKEIVRVEVSDTGPGISEEERKKLFVKFYRAESTAGKTFGTGLGLYITKLLIDNFGGVMGLDSELDKGTTFWFELPVKIQV